MRFAAFGWTLVLAACSEPSPDATAPDPKASPTPTALPPPTDVTEATDATGPADAPGSTNPPELKFDMKTATTWAPVETWPGARTAHSAIARRVALRPDGTPAVAGDVTAIAATMTRGFQLSHARLLVGEPLVVSLRVELAASHADDDADLVWAEDMGSNYRGRGRDDNFAFVLEAADGTFVPDIFQGPVFVGGGMGAAVDVTPDTPFVHHSAVQHYASIADPGNYTLHCVFFARGHSPAGWDESRSAHALAQLGSGSTYDPRKNVATGADGKTYAVIPSLGDDFGTGPIRLAAPLEERWGPDRAQITDYAAFDLEIVEGTAAERNAMVARWATLAESARDMAWPRDINDAAKEAISYARQDDFVPTMQSWLERDPHSATSLLQGLAMRDSPAAVKLVIKYGRDASWYGLGDLSDAAVRNNAAELVELLADSDAETRSAAFALLSRVSDDRFGAQWPGYDRTRPTPVEAKVMLPIVRRHFGVATP